MRKAILVLAGGFCGTLARYLLGAPLLALADRALPGARGGFPFDILTINLAGAFAIGLLYGLSDRGAIASPAVRLALGTGFLGAFTTFSTLAYGGDQLLLAGVWLSGALYLGGSLLLGFALARAGYGLAGALTRQPARVVVRGDGATGANSAGARARRPAWVAAVWRDHELSSSDQDMARWTDGLRDADAEALREQAPTPDEVR